MAVFVARCRSVGHGQRVGGEKEEVEKKEEEGLR